MRRTAKILLYVLCAFSFWIFVNLGFFLPGKYDGARALEMCAFLGLSILLSNLGSRIDTRRKPQKGL